MEDQVLKSLREEYANLFTLIQHYYTSPYSVIPVGITLLGALTLYGVAGEKGRSPKKGFWGIVVCYSMVTLAIWETYVHTMLCTVGIRLVKLECLINQATGVTVDNGLGFFSTTLGAGYTMGSGLTWTTLITCGFALAVYVFAAKLGWRELDWQELSGDSKKIPKHYRWLIILIPLFAMLGLLASMWRTEIQTGEAKRELLLRFPSKLETSGTTVN